MTAALKSTTVPRSPTRSPAAPRPVVIRPAPRREPPFDDERPENLVGRYDQRLPFALVARPRAWRTIPTLGSGLPDPGAWAQRLLVGMTETAAGRRPLQQLAAMLSPSVGTGIGGDFARARTGGGRHWLARATVRSVRSSRPREDVAEVAATVQTGQRVRAIALRLESHHGRWRCTRLQLG